MATGVKRLRRMRGPARQPSYGRAKNDPAKKVAKQQVANRTVEWLMAELQDRPGYANFRDTFHQIKSNPHAVRSWTFAADCVKEYNRQKLVVSSVPPRVSADFIL
jgi:hypothetical protein